MDYREIGGHSEKDFTFENWVLKMIGEKTELENMLKIEFNQMKAWIEGELNIIKERIGDLEKAVFDKSREDECF